MGIPNTLSNENREKARRILFQAHLYRIAGIGTLFAALFLFVMLYIQNINGNPGILLRKPILILWMFSPFVPPLVLFLLSKKAMKNTRKILDKASS